MLAGLKNSFLAFTGDPAARLFKQLSREDVSRIGIYGMGEIGQHLVKLIKSSKSATVDMQLYDSKAEYNAFEVLGLPVRGPEALGSVPVELMIVASVKFTDEIQTLVAEKLGENTPKCLTLE